MGSVLKSREALCGRGKGMRVLFGPDLQRSPQVHERSVLHRPLSTPAPLLPLSLPCFSSFLACGLIYINWVVFWRPHENCCFREPLCWVLNSHCIQEDNFVNLQNSEIVMRLPSLAWPGACDSISPCWSLLSFPLSPSFLLLPISRCWLSTFCLSMLSK